MSALQRTPVHECLVTLLAGRESYHIDLDGRIIARPPELAQRRLVKAFLQNHAPVLALFTPENPDSLPLALAAESRLMKTVLAQDSLQNSGQTYLGDMSNEIAETEAGLQSCHDLLKRLQPDEMKARMRSNVDQAYAALTCLGEPAI